MNDTKVYLKKCWGNDADNVISAIDAAITEHMTTNEFLSHCTACGGNWGGMLLTGIHELWPDVWDAIPDDMGPCSFTCLCSVLELLGVVEDDRYAAAV